MADPVLHIKDSYYFEVPKVLCPAHYQSREDFPKVWITLDPEFQNWEFSRLYAKLSQLDVQLPPKAEAQTQWHEWQHADHLNFAKPFDQFLEEKYERDVAAFNSWKTARIAAAQVEKDEGAVLAARRLTLKDYLHSAEHKDDGYVSFSEHRAEQAFQSRWSGRQSAASVEDYLADPATSEWSAQKIQSYNGHLSGKILIPQPFATLRNLYEKENPYEFAISKYMLIEVFVGLVIVLLFAWLANRVKDGSAPKGYVWNLLESFLVFIRDQIARPVLGTHHDHAHEEHGKAEHAAASHGHEKHGHGEKHKPVHAAHAPVDPATRFTPLLWTIFFFVLGCNLMGMVPWAGAPTASFGVTFALAMVTFITVCVAGMMQFGVVGFFLNQIPSMDLPWYMAIVIKPMLFAIEMLGLLIKHGVLAVRLLANMVAGHLVILGVMGLAFGAEAALTFSDPDMAGWMWPVTMVIAVVASAAFNLLELFVAFLQAYVFTFLTALFIGAAIHKH